MTPVDHRDNYTVNHRQSSDLVHAYNNQKNGPLASPETQENRETLPSSSDRSGSDHISGAAFLAVAIGYSAGRVLTMKFTTNS